MYAGGENLGSCEATGLAAAFIVFAVLVVTVVILLTSWLCCCKGEGCSATRPGQGGTYARRSRRSGYNTVEEVGVVHYEAVQRPEASAPPACAV